MINVNNGLQFANKHKVAIGAGLGLAAVGTVGAIALAKHKSKKKPKTSRKKAIVRYRSSKRRKQRYPRTAGKRKDRSHKRIRYTKNNQPYIILANGRARFISKKSARISRKRKGGRY